MLERAVRARFRQKLGPRRQGEDLLLLAAETAGELLGLDPTRQYTMEEFNAALGEKIQVEQDRRGDRDITLELTDEARAFIARASYTPAFGARPVKRYLQKHVETELAAMLIRSQLSDGQRVVVGSGGDSLTFRVA